MDDGGTVTLHASPALARSLDAAARDGTADLTPLRFDDPSRGLALAASLVKGVRAHLLEFEFASGAFEVRAFFRGRRVRLTLQPGNFDPDEAWEFFLAANEARLEPHPA